MVSNKRVILGIIIISLVFVPSLLQKRIYANNGNAVKLGNDEYNVNTMLVEIAERYGVARYVPLITEDEYILAEEKNVLEKFGSAKTLALAMVRNGHLTNADIEELREYFKMGGNGK